MDLKTLLYGLGIEKDWDMFAEIYPAAKKLFEEEGLWYLEKDFLEECHKKYDLFGKYKDVILETAAQIKADKYLSAYLSVLRYIVHTRPDALSLLGTVPLPKPACEENRLKTELMPFYVFPPEADKLYGFLIRNDMPQQTVNSSMQGFIGGVYGFEQRHGRVGFERLYLVWCMHYVECKLLRLENLNFELTSFKGGASFFADSAGNIAVLGFGAYHKSGNRLNNPGFKDEEGNFKADFTETDTYYEGVPVINGYAVNKRVRLDKNKWKMILSKGDPVINVHIPGKTDISPAALKSTYSFARKKISAVFPEYKNAPFVCFSWLLDPVLSEMLTDTSRISGFQKQYIRFPVTSSGMDVFIFLFATDERDYTKLPENTSLERAVKKYYINGNYIHKFGGAILPVEQI